MEISLRMESGGGAAMASLWPCVWEALGRLTTRGATVGGVVAGPSPAARAAEPGRLHLIGWPSLVVDLGTGRTASGPVDVHLGPAELALLRALAARPGRACRRAQLARALGGAPLDEVLRNLVSGLGPFGHHVERAGPDAWQLWQGPE